MEISGTNKAIRTNIRKIAGLFGVDILDIMYATVEKVDASARTCDVKPITGKSDTEITDVNLQADSSDGQLVIPKIGSTVIVGISATLDAFVFMYSDVDSISWKGGNFGGLVKVAELTTKLNNVEQLLNGFIAKYNIHFHPVVGITVGGATVPSSPTAQTETTILTPTVRSEIENEKIKHGNK